MSRKLDMGRWLPHLAAAKRSGKSLAAYAAEHGLSRATLYTARHRAKSAGRGSRSRPAPSLALSSAFSEVRLRPAEVDRRGVPEYGSAARATLRARLPNGTVIELDGCDAAEDRFVRTLIDALAGRPCSGSIPR